MASEGKQRKLVRELTDGLKGEFLPFSFPDQQRGHIVKQAPCVWVEDLERKIVETIEFNDRYTESYIYIYTVHVLYNREHRLTWHSGLIPPQEIWVKIGGDKGQGSMKTSFQICNVPHPNSCKNSVIFSIFEATDTATNINIALEYFRPQVNSLSGKTIWGYIKYVRFKRR